MGRGGDGEMGRWGDGVMGRRGEGGERARVLVPLGVRGGFLKDKRQKIKDKR